MEYLGLSLPVEILFQVVSYNPSPSLALVNKSVNEEVTRIYNASSRYLLNCLPHLGERLVAIDHTSTPPMRFFLHLMGALHGDARHLDCDISAPESEGFLAQELEWDHAHFKMLAESVGFRIQQAKAEDFKRFVKVVAEAAGIAVAEEFNPNELWTNLVNSLALGAIEGLTLNKMGFKFLPPEIASLGSLTRLYLEGNDLRTLPDEMNALLRLERLYLDKNKLEWISDSIALPSVQYLELRNNRLKEIPNLANYPSMRIVYMHKNQVEEIRDMTNAPATLQKVYLKNNPIRTIPHPIPAKIEL